MPPKKIMDKETILQTGLTFIQENGVDSFNARSLAKKLKCSTQPIFSSFSSMKELRDEIKKKALGVYGKYIEEGMQEDKKFKGMGKAYIRFASEEPNLFKLVFMDSNKEDYKNIKIEDDDSRSEIVKIIMQSTGLSEQKASYMHLYSFVFVHGIASLIVSKTVFFSEEIISDMLTDFYLGVSNKLKENEQ